MGVDNHRDREERTGLGSDSEDADSAFSEVTAEGDDSSGS